MDMIQFINKYGLRMHVELVSKNPNMNDMPQGSNHYRCVFKRVDEKGEERFFECYFSKGPALSGEPSPEAVLECLASDCASIYNSSVFEDWANDMGWDADSRKAEACFKAVYSQKNQLEAFLGELLLEEMMFEVQRAT